MCSDTATSTVMYVVLHLLIPNGLTFAFQRPPNSARRVYRQTRYHWYLWDPWIRENFSVEPVEAENRRRIL